MTFLPPPYAIKFEFDQLRHPAMRLQATATNDKSQFIKKKQKCHKCRTDLNPRISVQGLIHLSPLHFPHLQTITTTSKKKKSMRNDERWLSLQIELLADSISPLSVTLK